jgi:hypothetical protein
MRSRQGTDGLGALGAVDVQDVEQVATGEADVGLGVAGPPGQDPSPIAGRVVHAVGDQAAQGMLADLAAARIPTRAAGRSGRRMVAADRLEAASVGDGVVEGQDRDAAGGIAHGGVA